MVRIGFFISLGIAAALITEPFVRSRMVKVKPEDHTDKAREEFKKKAEYNRANLPSVDLPPIEPDWTAVDGFIMKTRFRFTDEGVSVRVSRLSK